MNKKLKRFLEFLGVLAITAIIMMSSPLNPYMTNVFTDIQEEIYDTALQIRNGFLAYVELDGHYGPVLYEYYGLGYLPTYTHIGHFVMECVVIFAIVAFQYKTAKLFTSEFFAMVSAGFLTIFEWGALTHAGAEEFMFLILTLTCYHVARQLTKGYLSYHAYLLAIDLGFVFFLQPGYSFIWVYLIIFFAIKFKIDGIEGGEYGSYFLSVFEGLLTVGAPMGIYLWYFKNAEACWQNVILYNLNNIGGFAEGIKIVCGSPWFGIVILFVIVTIIKVFMNDDVWPLCGWLAFVIVTLMVIALQGDNLSSFLELSKAVYIVPIASVFSLLDKVLGFKIEERE